MAARICTLAVALVCAGSLALSAQQATPAAGRSQWSGIYSAAQAARGEPLYAENCAFCHGIHLEGSLSAPPLTAASLTSRWQGKTLADLFDYQLTFMPWTSPGGFGRPQNIDILAYVLKKGGFPAGTELPSAPEAQRAIRLIAATP